MHGAEATVGLASGLARVGRSGRENESPVADNRLEMTFTLELSDEDLLGELMGALADQGCLTDRIGSNACRVVTPHGWTAREARLEVGLFVRAWQGRHPGVEAVLIS
jgi:hypothetical protein